MSFGAASLQTRSKLNQRQAALSFSRRLALVQLSPHHITRNFTPSNEKKKRGSKVFGLFHYSVKRSALASTLCAPTCHRPHEICCMRISFTTHLHRRSNIRPVREVLRDIPAGRRSTVETLLAPRYRRAPSNTTDDFERRWGDANKNRLATIMSVLPLRKAFGEFCRKSLCSEVSAMHVSSRTPFGCRNMLIASFSFRTRCVMVLHRAAYI